MEYLRDGRAPIPNSETTSKVMSANKAKNTKPELKLREALDKLGLNNYEIHLKDIKGKPDIAFFERKLAIFVHGCFWHHCPICKPSLPKSNTEFWKEKFQKNKERDRRKKAELEENGWTVLVIWEHEIKKDVNICAARIRSLLSSMH